MTLHTRGETFIAQHRRPGYTDVKAVVTGGVEALLSDDLELLQATVTDVTVTTIDVADDGEKKRGFMKGTVAWARDLHAALGKALAEIDRLEQLTTSREAG